MTGISIIRKNLASAMTGAPVELRAFEGWIQWRQADSDDAWQNLHEIPADGSPGATGLPGAAGASVELRVHGGWVQWRQDDDNPTWENLFSIPEGGGGGGGEFDIEYETIESLILLTETVLTEDGEIDIDLTQLGDLTGFVDLEMYYEWQGTSSTYVYIYFNGDYTNGNYRALRQTASVGAVADATGSVVSAGYLPSVYAQGRAYIPRFQSGMTKTLVSKTAYRFSAGSNDLFYDVGLHWTGNDPINRITCRVAGHPTHVFKAGSVVRLYGRKAVEVVTGLDGGGMFKGEPGADGADGQNGRDVEMQSVVGEDGRCQTIQWRLMGDETWLDLVTTPVCLDEPVEPVITATLANRCGTAVAVVAELKRIFDRAVDDPEIWAQIQNAANNVSAGINVAGSAVLAVAAFAGVSISGGAALMGAGIAGAIHFLGDVAGLLKPTHEFDNDNEDYLVSTLFCVLSRRETAEISADVLREWAGYVNDIPDFGSDAEMLLRILGVMPIEYWRNEGLYSQPTVNKCLDACPPSRSGDWSYQIGDAPIEPLIHFNSAIARIMLSVDFGKVYQSSIEAIRTPLNTMVYQITFKFGRLVNLTGIDVGVTYLQTVDATNNVISVVGFGGTEISGITGSLPEEATFRWRLQNPVQVSSLIISGKISIEDADTPGIEYLLLDYVRLCGTDYAPLGELVINALGDCGTFDPCLDGPDYGTDHCYTWDFTSSDGNWSANWATWEAGVGWKANIDYSPAYHRQKKLNIWSGAGNNSLGRTIRRVEIDATFTRGQVVDYAATAFFIFRDNMTDHVLIQDTQSFSGVLSSEEDFGPDVLRTGLEITSICSSRNAIGAPLPNPQGEVIVRRVSVWYDGPDAEFTGGSGS